MARRVSLHTGHSRHAFQNKFLMAMTIVFIVLVVALAILIVAKIMPQENNAAYFINLTG